MIELKPFIKTKDKLKDTYLWEYRESIRTGETIAGYYMIQELDNLIEEFMDDGYLYDTTKAYIYINFIENNIKHTKAPYYGEPFILDLWEKALIEVVYSFKMKSVDTGKWVRRFVELLMWIARKNGKTTFIAAILLTELLLAKDGTQIVCSGMNDGIADLAYTEIKEMIYLIDPQQALLWVNQKGIKNLVNRNFMKKLSDSTRGKDGRNVAVAGIDEIWELKDDGIYAPIRQSASTQPEYIVFLFSTEGTVVDGFGDMKLKEYIKIINREDTSITAKRKLPWIYKQDSEDEVWETNEEGISPLWEKSNPSLGRAKLYSFLRDVVEEARTNTRTRLTVLTKDFNIKQGATEKWFSPHQYQYDAPFDLADFKNYYAVASVDLAQTTDMVSARVYIIRKNDRRKFTYQHYWIPQSKIDNEDDIGAGAKYEEWKQQRLLTVVEGNDIGDLGIVADWLYDFVITNQIYINRIGYDQKFKTDFIRGCEKHGWVDKENLIVINQSPETLDNANCQLEADLNDHLIYGLNDIDRWCLGNVGLKINGAGKSLICRSDRHHKIDGVATLVMCQEMLNRYKDELKENNPE